MQVASNTNVEKGQGANKKRPRSEEKTDTKIIQIPGAPKQFATAQEFINTLIRTGAQQLPISDGKIFVAQRTDKVVDVWKGLIKHNFLSVPVLQKTGNKWYGFLDMADIVKFVVQQFGATKLKATENFWELVEKEEYFQTRTVNDVMVYPLRKRNPFHPIPRGYSLFAVMEVLARERGLHRVPIIDHDFHLTHLVTQSQLVSYLHKNLDTLGDVKNKPCHMVTGFGTGAICIKQDATAMDAFDMMIRENISGLGVIDDDGKLTGNISLRDLKAISNDARMFWRLYEPIKSFLHHVTDVDLEADPEKMRPRRVLFAKESDTLESIIKKLSEHNIHRIFVVDTNQKPMAVISLKDLLYEIITSF